MQLTITLISSSINSNVSEFGRFVGIDDKRGDAIESILKNLTVGSIDLQYALDATLEKGPALSESASGACR